MKQQQFYKYATWGLLLLNLGLIASWMIFRPGPRHHHEPFKKDRALEMMQLDETQHEQFLETAHAHGERIEPVSEEQRKLLEAYFQSLVKTVPDSIREANLAQALELERQKIALTYKHFEEVKALLRPDQVAGFEKFMEQAMRVILQKGGGQPAHPQRGARPPKENH